MENILFFFSGLWFVCAFLDSSISSTSYAADQLQFEEACS